jgi:hypothetical protein
MNTDTDTPLYKALAISSTKMYISGIKIRRHKDLV